jgi:hypothetical protein
MRLLHRIHNLSQFQRADLDDRVSLDEELLQLFRCEMAIRTSVGILCARLSTREDLLTAAIVYKARQSLIGLASSTFNGKQPRTHLFAG